MRIISKSAQQTLSLGRAVARQLCRGDIICLFGKFGAGKTVFTKGIAAGLGIKSSEVCSPSFVLIREYPRARVPLFHFDLYRLKNESDILELGYQEYFYDDAVTVIEWADRLKHLLPKEFLKIELSLRPGSRRAVKFSAFGRRYKELLRKIDENISH